MTHLRIEQNNGVIEEVSSSVITKLYEIAHTGLDVSSNLQGRLHVTGAYGYQIDYLTQQYPNLYINADKRYFHFEDPVVEQLCATKWGDGTGITESDMQSVTAIDWQTFNGNTNIQTFDELGDFPNLTRIQTYGFSDCTNLRSIDLSNIQYFGGQAFQSTSLTGIINLPSAIEIGDNSRGQAFGYIAGITEVHIGPNFQRFVNGANFKHCSQLTKITGLENIASVPGETFRENPSLQEVDISSAKNISGYAFQLCRSLTDIGELSGTITIGQSAFDTCTNLQQSCINNASFVFPSQMDQGANFYGCEGLTNITLSTSNTTIPLYAFSHCTNLTTITNNQYVTRIGAGAFNQCNKLTSLDLSNLDTTDSYVQTAFATDSPYDWNKGLFTGDAELTTLGRSVFPDITKLGQRSFNGCTKLAGSLIFPDMTTEGREIFQGCRALEYVYLGHIQTLQANNIYDHSGEFLNCENLKAVYLGDSITNLSLYQFAGCTQLRAVIINNTTVPGYDSNGNNTPTDQYVTRNDMLGNSVCFLYVPDSAVNTYKQTYPWSKFPDAIKSFKDYTGHFEFYNETFTNGKYKGYGFGSLNIVDSLGSGSLPQNAFNSCVNLTNVTLEGISSIGVNAFGSCTSLESINLDGVTINGDGAFIGCTSLTTIGNNSMLSLFPNGKVRTWSFGKCSSLQGPFDFTGITEIGGSSFERSGLSGILNLPDVVTIGNSNAFGNTNITKAIIGDSITSIGGSCFNGCTSLTEVDIDFSNIPVANQGNMTSFVSGCTSLQTFDCTGLEVLANQFFSGCTGLTSITGLNNVTTIGSKAFLNCTSLTSVSLPNCTTINDEQAFTLSGITSISLPLCTTIGRSTFHRATSLTSVSIPSCTSIGPIAFDHCSSLTQLSLPEGLLTIGDNAFNASAFTGYFEIPSTVTSIGQALFYGSTGITGYVFKGSTPPALPNGLGTMFLTHENGNLVRPIYVPDAAVSAYQSAFAANQDYVDAIKPISQKPS